MRPAVDVVEVEPPPPPPPATVKVASAVLFAELGSVELADSMPLAVFVIAVPASALTVTWTVSIALEDGAILPTVQMPLVASYIPSVVVAELKTRPAGSISFTVTPVDVPGPRSFAMTV
jgi:hypothetical protein